MSTNIPAEHGVIRPTIFGREPVMYLSLIQAGLALVVGFGLDLSSQQIALVLGFSAAVLGFVARSAVTPVETLPDIPIDTQEGTVTGVR